jgi:hypothetical protein
MAQGGNLVFGQYTTVFQADMYVIMAYMFENLDRTYRNRNIIFSQNATLWLKLWATTGLPEN